MDARPDRGGAWREVRLHVALWLAGHVAGAFAIYYALDDMQARRSVFELAAGFLALWSPFCLGTAAVRIKHVYKKRQNTASEESGNALVAVASFGGWAAVRLLAIAVSRIA